MALHLGLPTGSLKTRSGLEPVCYLPAADDITTAPSGRFIYILDDCVLLDKNKNKIHY